MLVLLFKSQSNFCNCQPSRPLPVILLVCAIAQFQPIIIKFEFQIDRQIDLLIDCIMQTTGNPNDPDEQQMGNEHLQSPIAQLENRVKSALASAQADYQSYTKNDQELSRKDTVEVCLDILKRIKEAAGELNQKPEDVRERLYYLTFNATVLIFKICSQLRIAGYPKQATHYLAFNMLCLDNNLILTTVKYLDWRVLNYVELGRAYADMQAYKAALKVAEYGIQKVLYAKKVEEQDPPVPDGSKDTLVEALRVLRTQELKYQLQSGAINADAWKKKLEEVFSVNKYHRSLAIVESLSLNDVNNCNLVLRSAEHLSQKTACLKIAFEMVKPEVEVIKQALVQIHEKKKRDKDKKEKLALRENDDDLDELLENYKNLDNEMIKEADWKQASYNVPIEVHVELLKLCFESKMWTEFDVLLDPALVRLKFRRYEVPYLATVDIQMSSQKVSNIPNGFERLGKDLNAANLRIELKKLRASAKEGLEDDAPANGDKPQSAAGKKEDAKAKAPPAKADPKAKGGAPKGKDAAPAEEEKKDDDDDAIMASQKELDLIQHIYVNMLLQRTKNPQNAIVGLDVVLGDETIGPDLPDNHFAVAVPIRQHPGAYEKTRLIPYVVFKRTANSLIDEEDCLSIVTDVQVLMGQDRFLQPPLGYTKIPVDLRQTPADLERVPNLDYVYICYKTDKQLATVERDLLIFRRMAELERSQHKKGTPDFKGLAEQDRFLMTNFNCELLIELSRTLKESLLGPLGDYYLEKRRDILNDICCSMYQNFLLPVLQKIDQYIEMRNQKEFFGEFVDAIDEHVIRVKNQFIEVFNVIHRVLTRESFVGNIIMYIKFSIYYANLMEETGDFRNAVQSLRATLGKLTEYREERMKATLDSGASDCAAMSITVDNKRISELEVKIRSVTNRWKELVCRKERDRVRKEKEETALDEDEGDEEQLEVRLCEEELKDKDLFEKDIDRETWHVENDKKNKLECKKFFSEQDQILHALNVDVLMCLYRCEVKLGKEMNVVKNQTNKMLTTQGIDLAKHAPGNLTKNLATSLGTKMNMKQTSKTLAGSKNALKELQHTLQDAGKLPPAKPQVLPYEKILERENNRNPYQNALLYMSLAVSKSNAVSQKSLLLEALEYIKKAKASEEQLMGVTLENAVQVSAARFFHPYFGRSPDLVHPFNLLAVPLYIKKSPVPATPIMIARTSTSITMKLPFYKPITEYKAWRKISSTALYGKPSGSGVAVSLNNTDYEGTGEKKKPGEIIHVTGLIPNETYVFAAGGFTDDGICVNGIGETCKEILTLLPLPLMQIQGYLAEIAFKLGQYQIAKHAAEAVCSAFVIKNEFKYSFLDARVNPILAVKLNTAYFNLISPIEAKQLAESFIILARVSKIVKNDVQKRALTHELKVENQKMDMRIANYLLIALDIGTMLNRPILIKRTVCELYNHLLAYFQMQLQSPLLLHILVKCHQAIRLVPSDLIDSTCRRILSCLSFQIMKVGFQTSEEQMLRRVMLSELPINSRKWRKYAAYIVRQPVLSEEEQALKEAQQLKLQNKEEVPEEELVKDPEAVEEKHLKIAEFEPEGASFEEFLLSLGDYTDVVKAKSERWKTLIGQFGKQITDSEVVVEEERERITALVEFWEGVKVSNPIAQLQQLCQAADQESKRYLEFCCKCVRRAMEQPETDQEELARILTENVRVNEEDMTQVLDILEKRVANLDQDIVVKQRQRFEVLEEKVKTLLEERTLSGGNNQITTKQLSKLMTGTEGGIKGKGNTDSQSQQLVRFSNEGEKREAVYKYLWISEQNYLKGIIQFVNLAKNRPQRSLNDLEQPMNCIFDDIIRLDFTKFKTVLSEYQVIMRENDLIEKSAEEERKKAAEEAESAGNPPPSRESIKSEVNPEKKRVQTMAKFLEVMARAAQFALNSQSWLQLVSIILYVWNAFSYDLTNPLELTMVPEAWHSVVILAECSLYLLEFLQRGGKLRTLAGQEIDKVKNQKPRFDKEGRTVGFKFDQDSENEEEVKGVEAGEQTVAGGDQPEKSSLAKKTSGPAAAQSQAAEESKAPASGKSVKWFDTIDEFDMTTQASFISFALQCLMCVSKWESMVDISNRLNSATENQFASQLLPFIIYAQTTLFQKAADNTSEKKRHLEARIQEFEYWKQNSKKKRSRTASITGEIPPEEQAFLNDKASFEKEVFRLEVIENVLNSDKDASNRLLENIKRDANNAEESLKACRKLYFQFGVETENLKAEEVSKGCYGIEQINNHEIRSKRKSQRVFTNMVINSYKKTIELLRKRQEKYMLIQALHELGNLHYADGNLGEAEVQWNDCVDTIFQRLYVVKEFRQVFKDNPSLADSFGSKQVLVGGIVLTKLAKLCYEGKDLHKYSECILMASELFAAPAKLTLPHPQTPIEYSSYSFRELLDGRCAGESAVFQDQQVLQPSEILHTVQTVAQALLDMEVFPQVLPLCALMEYVSQNVVKSSILVTKARVFKANALIELGYINEALQIYKRVMDGKDLPKHGSRASEVLNRADGSNFHFGDKDGYRNDLSPEADENTPVLQYIQQEIQGDPLNKLKTYCSPSLIEEIKTLRCIFMVRLGEPENVENLEKGALRSGLLQSSEQGLRTILRQCQLNYEISETQEKIRAQKQKKIGIDHEQIESLTQKLTQIFENNGIPETETTTLYTNTEEEICFADKQSQALSQMMRCRLLIGRICRKQGLMVNGFYVLRECLQNFKKLAEGLSSNIEKGEESVDKGSLSLPEIYGGGGAQAAAQAAPGKKGGAPPAKAAAPAKGKKDEAAPEMTAAEEEARREREEKEAAQSRLEVMAQLRRKHPNMYLWLKTKVEILQILLSQNRIEDVQDALSVTKLECMSIKDQLCVRRLDEIEFMVLVKSGKVQEAIEKSNQINTQAKKYHQNDVSYAEFLGNLSELLYNLGKQEDACNIVKEGRKIAWYRLRDQGIEIEQQNINKATDVFVQNDRKRPNEEVLTAFASTQVVQGKDKKAAPAKDAKNAKGGAPVEEQNEIEEDDPVPLDFSVPIKYDLVPADVEINSSKAAVNIYLESLQLAIRFDIRYSQYCVILQKKYDLAVKLLKDTLKLIERTLYVSPQLKFYCQFLLGLANQKIFIDQVLQFQSQYSSMKKYKGSLTNHIPFSSIALGDYLIEMPNFSDTIKKKLNDLLCTSQKHYETAITISKNECILYEGDFDLKDACEGLSEVSFYLGEYRQRVLEYKYAQYQEQDRLRKQKRREELKQASEEAGDDAIGGEENKAEEQEDKWEEIKQSKETLEIYNCKKAAAHYLQSTIAVGEAQRVFLDEAHKISSTALADAAKVPREVASELFEASQVSKVVYEKLEGFEFKDKSSITSAEIVAYLKALLTENSLFTFGCDYERQGKLISKLHRYLMSNLSTYQAQCASSVSEYQPVDNIETAKTSELLGKAECLSSWIDVQGEKSNMFYVLGALDTEELKKNDEAAAGEVNADASQAQAPPATAASGSGNQVELTREQIAEIEVENSSVHYGKMEADSIALSKLHQDVRDLVNKMTASEKLSEAQNQRDRQGYQKTFESLIDRLGGFYKPPILSEEEADKDVDCLKLVKAYIPPLTIENVTKLALILRKEQGNNLVDPHYNAILRNFHRIRYAK